MEFQNLGKSGLKVSKIILGCMSIGSKDWGPYVIEDEQKVFKLLKHAYDKGMRTFDTANVYSHGESERLIGKFLKQYNINRSSVVIMSKCFAKVKDDPSLGDNEIDGQNRHGLSRKHVFDAVEASIQRLGTYIDVLQIHRLDRQTPKEEIMKALNDVVESGKVRYLGASSMRAFEFAQLQHVADLNKWHKFISMQNFYNLVYREEEREMNPYCKDTGVALVPWSPLCMGLIARPLGEETARSEQLTWIKELAQTEANKTIINRVEELAKKKNVAMAQIAIAWCLKQGTLPIIGLASENRIDQAIDALQVELSDEECKYLEDPYQPMGIKGFSVN